MEELRLPKAWQDWTVSEDGYLGQGAYGQVFRAEKKIGDYTGYCAIKIVSIPRSEEELRSVMLETGNNQELTKAYFRKSVEAGLTLQFGSNATTGGALLTVSSLATALIVGIITNLIVNNGRLSADEEDSSLAQHVENMGKVDFDK